MSLPKPYYEEEGITIYHGDCRLILPHLPKVDLVLTDPPYGVRDDQAWDDLSSFEFARISMDWMSAAKRLADSFVVFSVASGPMRHICELLFPKVRQIIWHKPEGSQYTGASEAKLWYAHETIYHCHDGTTWEVVLPKARRLASILRHAREKHGLSRGAVDIAIRGKRTGLCYRWEEAACIPTNEQAEKLKSLLGLNGEFHEALEEAYSSRDAVLEKAAEKAAEKTDVLSHRTITSPLHPCEKPVGLLSDLLLTVGHDAGTILDPFMGSGTTLRAAKDLGRKAIGIDIEEKYCQIAVERLRQGVLKL